MHKRILIVDPAGKGAELVEACRASAIAPFLLSAEDSPVNGIAQAQSITVRKLDAESIVTVARRHNAQGIWATTREAWQAALPAAERLNMPRFDARGHLNLYRDLLDKLAHAGVDAAPSEVAGTLSKTKAAAEKCGYPVWVRGTNELGPAFTMVVHEEADLSLAYKKAKKRSGQDFVQVQRAVDGPVYRVHGLKKGRHFHPVEVIAVTFSKGDLRYPVAYTVPSGLGGYDYTRVVDVARKAGNSLPSGFGPVAAEVAMTETGPVLLQVRETPEIDLHAAAVIKAALGVDLVADALRLAVGEEPHLTPSKEIGAALCWLPEVTGTVKNVTGVEEARAAAGVVAVRTFVRAGERLAHTQDTEGRDRLGYVLATGPTGDVARERAQAAIGLITIKTRSTAG